MLKQQVSASFFFEAAASGTASLLQKGVFTLGALHPGMV